MAREKGDCPHGSAALAVLLCGISACPRCRGRSGAGYVSGSAPAEITGSAFATVGPGCAALCVAGIALVIALTRAEDRAEAAVAQPAPAPGSGENASSASSRETAPVMAATTSSASG
ncbi:MAG: hypothetical protein JWR30_387 [Conexibacter sp.]|nr:hypothetical protein [Conexibacter sp.]